MNNFKLCYYSATSMEIPSLSAGMQLFEQNGGHISVFAQTQTQLFDDARKQAFAQKAMQCDIIIITLHGGRRSCPAFDALTELIEARLNSNQDLPIIHIHSGGGDEEGITLAQKYANTFGTADGDKINEYLNHGGSWNFRHLLGHLYHMISQDAPACEPPKPLPHEGIYHPEFSDFDDFEGYLNSHIDPEKPTIGLWFNQTYWVNNNLVHFDALIREIEKQGTNALPIFHIRYKDVERRNKGADAVSDMFFKTSDGKSRIDVLLNPQIFSLTLNCPDYQDVYPSLDVPVLQAMITNQPYEVWKDSVQGMSMMEVSYAAAQPEFDGALITIPVGTREENEVDPITGAMLTKYMPIGERTEKLVSLAKKWAMLRHKSNAEKRLAIVFHHNPPRNDRIGCAVGLDSFQSVNKLLENLKADGYTVERTYEKGDDLAHELLEKMTCDRRWLPPDKMAERAAASADRKMYMPWHNALPKAVREKMVKSWDEMPGDLFVHDEDLLFPGLINGNIFITIQPSRGKLERMDQLLHDPDIPPPHHYLAYYRWVRDIFQADAVMHVGKHGSLEWLPGKALGLSENCFPDLSIMDLPNIYPYIINDPSEGTQAKRRSYCCIIDHLTPVFTNADLYEDMAKVENLLRDYAEAKSSDAGKLEILRPMIWEAAEEADLDKDLELTKDVALADFDAFLEQLHAYLDDMSDTMISDGLHTFGEAPEGEQLSELLVQMTRIDNGNIPSLREALLEAQGYNYDVLLENKGKAIFGNAALGENGKTGGEVIREAHQNALKMMSFLESRDFHPEAIPAASEKFGSIVTPSVARVLDFICEDIVPNIQKTTDEMTASLRAFDGKFVPPGPSGAPTRGQADILPTGRNFYSVDPNKIPSPGAWEVGQRLGDALVERYLDETGKYPESIGIILFGGATMRSKGDDLAEILYLMGVRPIWQEGSGYVKGLEIVPADELKWPRLDVVPRISGFFRDAFPLLVERIDDAVQMVSALNEPPEINMLRRNVWADYETYKQNGMSEEEAMREATFRVFGCPPGTYGAGVEELIESKNWKTQDDLAANYIRYSAHAYGKGSYGKQKPKTFKTVLSRMDVTVKNEDSREYDMFSCTDYYNYYGGLIVASKVVRGEDPFSFMGDSADPKRVQIRTTEEEAKHIFRARLLNPKWLDGLKRHGYKGAGDISKMMDVILGWDATAEVVDDWMYERVAKKYALDPEMKEWMQEVNPYAHQNILDKLLESISRGMWNASEEMTQQLREEYLETEGKIEDLTE